MVSLPSSSRTLCRMPSKPKWPSSNRLRVKSDAPIPHFQPNVLALLGHRDRHPLALAVLAGIGQRLLGDAVDRILQDRRESLEIHVAIELDRRSATLPLFVNQM